MRYVDEFVNARKAYQNKIHPFSPTKVLVGVIDDPKMKLLAQKLDDAKKLASIEMDEAVKAFDVYRPAYIKKINGQIYKEPQAIKIKATVQFFVGKLQKLVDDYHRECVAKQKVESDKASKAQVAVAKEQVKLIAADIKKISDEFHKRAVAYEKVAASVYQTCNQFSQRIGQTDKEMTQLATQAQTLTKGPANPAMLLKVKALAQGKQKVLEANVKGQEKIIERLKPFDKSTNLTPQDIARDLRIKLPDTANKDMENLSKKEGPLFQRANQMAGESRSMLKADAELLSKSQKLLAQINSVGGSQASAKAV